jgi:hypothetical protein
MSDRASMNRSESMAIIMSNEPIVGIGARTSPRAAALAKWLGLVVALLAYWFDWPSWVLISSIGALAYGVGASDGYRWAREQRWMEWMAENVDPEWGNQIDGKWLDCKR